MFQPSRCPQRTCSQHSRPRHGFYTKHGSYSVKCRPYAIPRFRCRSCRRTFSRQTFRMDYRDHRPDLNVRLFRYLASGLGLRQSSRNLGLSLRCTELKFRKIARHLRRLNLNLRGPLPEFASFQLDELETDASPAQLLGFTGRREGEVLSWRQDWAARSPAVAGQAA